MRRRFAVVLIAAALAVGGCAQPATQPGNDASLDVPDIEALATVDDLAVLADADEDLDLADPDDDLAVVDDVDLADLALPDFDQELDLGD